MHLWGAAGGEARRAGVVAQASGKGGGQGAPAKMALVGKKLQLKPPVPRPEQKEGTEQGGRGGSGAHAEEETQRKEKEAAAEANPVQSKETRGVQEGAPSQQAEAEDRAAAAEGAGVESAEEGEAGPSAGAGGRALSAEKQAAEIQALRKVLQGASGGEPARSSGALYAGVLEEIGLINWPPLGQVAGTTALVMGMLVGAAAVLTAFNYGLSEGTKAFFEDGSVRDAVRSSLHL
jgi:preprotein translocase subunit SecE